MTTISRRHPAPRRRRAFLVAVASFVLTVALLNPGSPAAAAGALPVVAPPNGATVGFATRALVIPAGGSLDILGADTTAHNVACAKKRKRRPLCQSSFAAAGQIQPVLGVEKLKPGTYALLCQLHPQMTAELTVLDTP